MIIGDDGCVERIVEWADATDAERAVDLCNAGVLCAAAADMARWLRAVRTDNAKGEYYLTDVVALARADGAASPPWKRPPTNCAGINSRAELGQAEAVVQALAARSRDGRRGDHDRPVPRCSCAPTPSCRPDVTIEPNVVFGPGVTVASGVR